MEVIVNVYKSLLIAEKCFCQCALIKTRAYFAIIDVYSVPELSSAKVSNHCLKMRF